MEATEANGFTSRDDSGEEPGFIIEVADGHKGRTFTVKPLGNDRFELLDEQQQSIGTVQLDQTDHARCESQGCELDLPLLHSVREQIQFHKQWRQHESS